MAVTDVPASRPTAHGEPHAAPVVPDGTAAPRAAARATAPKRGYGWLIIMLLIAAMFGTPVVIAAIILLRGA